MPDMTDIGFLSLEDQRRIQTARLREHVRYCHEHSPFYRARKDCPADVSPDTLAEIPLTDKAVFAERNAEFLAVPRTQIADIVFSSGTTGMPTPVMYTASDLTRLAEQEARAFASNGVTPEDTALLTCTLDRCFVAGYAYCSGLQKLGASVIRNGISPLENHVAVMRALSPTVIVGVPVFLRRLGQMLDGNTDARRVRRLICIGEPLRDERMNPLPLAQDLQRLFPNATAHSTYASSEGVTPFCECEACCGGHLHMDAAVLEIADEAGRPLPDGQPGEIVITPLGVRGMPLLRFRTGDISFMMSGPCRCGRNSPRLGPVIGRRNQMMKINGTSLYPSAFFNALDKMPGISQSYVTVSSEDRLSDSVRVTVSVREPTLTADEITRSLQAALRVKPQVSIEPEETVSAVIYTRTPRKPIRFIDKREGTCL